MTLPKKRDAENTRKRILRAAQTAFSQSGYASVGIRAIAKDAGVNSALISRYFGSKANLFEQSLLDAFYNRGVFVQERQNFGETIARLIVTNTDTPLPAMSILATGDPVSREVIQRLAKEYMIDGLARWLGPPDERARALNMVSLMTGFAIFTHQMGIQPVPPSSIEWLSRQIQAIVDNS